MIVPGTDPPLLALSGSIVEALITLLLAAFVPTLFCETLWSAGLLLNF